MENNFVLYEQAVALEELGFDEPCFAYFKDSKITGVNKWDREDYGFHCITKDDVTSVSSEIVLAPLYQQAFDWFERKHSMYIARSVDATVNEILGISYYIESWRFNSVEVEFNENPYDCFDTEKARIACVRKLIEIAKQSNK